MIFTDRRDSMNDALFCGAATALITPFYRGAVDYPALERLLYRQISADIPALVIAGSTGEAATLHPEEWEELLRFSRQHLPPSVKLIAGIGGNDTALCGEKARKAEAMGCDGLLLTPPYCNKANRSGILAHFRQVADRSALPLIVYNVPSRTAVPMDAEMYAALAEHPRICGVKEASGSISLVSETMSLCGDAFTVWSGNDGDTLALMALGALGAISVASNLLPGDVDALCRHCLAGEYDKARELHRALDPLFSGLFTDVNPIPVKTAMARLGLCSDELRLPLTPTTREKEQKLLSLIRNYSIP